MTSESANGRYYDGDEIGRGAMGSINQATDRSLNRPVAMKILKHQGHELSEARFTREAMVLARLEHPNIVPIHDFGRRPDGSVFYTMKLVRGATLGSILDGLRDGRSETVEQYSLPRLLQIFRKLCDAMAFSHQQGIIHRDLKPENVMVGAFGEVLVMDWGIAKISESFTNDDPPSMSNNQVDSKDSAENTADGYVGTIDEEPAADDHLTSNSSVDKPAIDESSVSSAGTDDFITQSGDFVDQGEGEYWTIGEADVERSSQLTLDGSVMGTPHYMAPEQARGNVSEHDNRTDIYSLGAILYQMLTLRPPVSGAMPQVLSRVINGRIDPPVSYNTDHPKRERAKSTKDEKPIGLVHCPGGKIPTALSAVAMRALATRSDDRYQSVDELLADIDAWEGGFATSAEDIGTLGQIRLLIERHRIVTASAALLVIFGLAFVVQLIASEDRAKQGEQAARQAETEARSAEQLAETARTIAVAAKNEALKAADTAVKARTEANVAREKTRIELGRANLALADTAWANRDSRSLSRYLNNVPPDLRETDSAWRYLKSKLEGSTTTLPSLGKRIGFWPGNESQPPAFVAFQTTDSGGSLFNKLDFIDCVTGEIQRSIKIKGWVFTISPDGRRLAAGVDSVEILNIEKGIPEKSPPEISGRIFAMEFSHDSQRLFIRTESGTRDLHVFEVETGTKLWTVSGNSVNGSPGIGQFAVDPKGRWVAAHFMSSLQEVWILDVQTGEKIRRMDTGNSFLWDLEFSPDGKLLASADFQGYGTVWEPDEGNIRLRLRAASGHMTHLGFTSDNHLVTFSRDSGQENTRRRLQLWELTNGTEIDSRIGISPTTTSFALNPDNGSVLIGGTPSAIWKFPIETPAFLIEGGNPGAVGFLGDDFLICPAKGERSLAMYDLRSPDELKPLWRMPDSRSSSSLGGNFEYDKVLIYGTHDKEYHRVEFSTDSDSPGETKQPVFDLPTLDIQFAKTSDRILGIKRQRRRNVLVLDMAKEEPLVTLTGPAGTKCIAVGWVNGDSTALGLYQNQPDGYMSNDVLYCWDMATLSVQKKIRFTSAIYDLATSKDGRYFALAGQDRSIEIYDSKSLQQVLQFRAHDAPISHLTFHPSLPIIASGSDDLSIRIWDVESGNLLKTILGATRPVRSLAFNASGSLLACSSLDKVTRVWKVAGPELLETLRQKNSIEPVVVDPKNKL